MEKRERARSIVRNAATKVKSKMAKSWLLNDEFGGWEKTALECLSTTDAKARALGMSEEDQDEEISTYLGYLAVQVALIDAKKTRKKLSRSVNG